MKLWCYARPNAMTEHEFTDDVAICEANSIEEATEKFSKLYTPEQLSDCITEVQYCSNGVFICTDY